MRFQRPPPRRRRPDLRAPHRLRQSATGFRPHGLLRYPGDRWRRAAAGRGNIHRSRDRRSRRRGRLPDLRRRRVHDSGDERQEEEACGNARSSSKLGDGRSVAGGQSRGAAACARPHQGRLVGAKGNTAAEDEEAGEPPAAPARILHALALARRLHASAYQRLGRAERAR